ncbi:MAG TPA: CapA family protein [Candidatus Limnocylindrales bacterium]
MSRRSISLGLALLAAVAVLAVGGSVLVGGSLGPISGGAQAGPAANGPPANDRASVSRPEASTGGLVASASPPAAPSPGAATLSPGAATPAPGATPSPSAEPTAFSTPIVPVVDFRSTTTSVGPSDVAAILAGRSATYAALELVAADADAILSALGQTRPADRSLIVRARDAGRVMRDLAAHRDRLGFLAAADIGPGVRAIGWGGHELFGVDRVRSLADWPLEASLVRDGRQAFDPATTWTIVGGGDILLDRGVARQVTLLHKGVDFPFDGGTAEITGRFCCSSFGWQLPRVRRTGNAGAVRHLLESADLAVANFENPSPDAFRYHTHGTVFSAEPRLIDGLAGAGIDWVSLANNHIGDAGRRGILQTIENLHERAIDTSGAGATDAAAHRAALLRAGGLEVAFLGYDTIAPAYAAGADRPGNAQMTPEAVRADVAAARRAGADVVVVYPHWGVEYTVRPTALQRSLARAAIDAGADLVIGNHPHWVQGLEYYGGKLIAYAHGNFIFDQSWSRATQEGVIGRYVFYGDRLVAARYYPVVISDDVQPQLVGGEEAEAILGRMRLATGVMSGE